MFNRSKKGFTLIEMLIVIAIIAVLVAIIIPTIANSTVKANAATDGANLRSMLAILNVKVIDTAGNVSNAVEGMDFPESKTFPDAHVEILYAPSHYIHLFYVKDGNYYGVDYFSEVAQTGSSSKTAKPVDPYADWYIPET